MISKIIRFFLGTATDGITSKAAGAISGIGLIAALTPFAIWLLSHKEEVYITIQLTYGELALYALVFWGIIELFRTVKDTS